MSEKDRFGGRLKRIQESKTPAQNKRPIAAQPKAARAAQRTPKPEPAPRDSTGSIEAWTLGLLGLFLIPMGVFAAVTAYDLDLKLPTFDRNAQTVDAAADRLDRNIIERLIFGPAPPFLYTYLPPAPEGWVRVTPADTQQDVQAAIAALGARYPGGESALRAHPVFQPTAQFLDLANDPRVSFPPLNVEVWHQAYYLHPSGAGLVAKLAVRSSGSALGPANDPAAWQAELLRKRELYSSPRNTYETVDVAGFSGAATIHRDPGLPATLDGSTQVLGRVDMHLAISPRAVIELRGAADGQDLSGILAGVDAAAIAERAAQEN